MVVGLYQERAVFQAISLAVSTTMTRPWVLLAVSTVLSLSGCQHSVDMPQSSGASPQTNKICQFERLICSQRIPKLNASSEGHSAADWRQAADYRSWTSDFCQRLTIADQAENLLQWSESLLSEGGETRNLAADEVPDWVLNLDPTSGTIRKATVIPKQGQVRLYWGGGFAMWGIIVSPVGQVEPSKHMHLVSCQRGVYVFHLIGP